MTIKGLLRRDLPSSPWSINPQVLPKSCPSRWKISWSGFIFLYLCQKDRQISLQRWSSGPSKPQSRYQRFRCRIKLAQSVILMKGICSSPTDNSLNGNGSFKPYFWDKRWVSRSLWSSWHAAKLPRLVPAAAGTSSTTARAVRIATEHAT